MTRLESLRALAGLLLLGATGAVLVAPSAFADAGSGDGTFAGGGCVQIPREYDGFGNLTALTVLGDGRILVGGNDTEVFGFTADGTQYLSFETSSLAASVNGVAVQPSGRIVTGGWDSQFGGTIGGFNADGSVDTSFGVGGKVAVSFRINDLRLQSDQKIVVVGETVPAATTVVARYTANGSPDASFGSGGSVTLPNAAYRKLLIQSDGKLVAAGTDVVRLLPDGSIDSSFGAGGVVAGANADGIAVQSDGKLVVAGPSTPSGDFRVSRLNGDGSPDTSFGTGGTVVTDLGMTDTAVAVAVAADGKLVVGGSSGDPNRDHSFRGRILRYNPDGSHDQTFAAGGSGADCSEGIAAVGFQPSGKIITAGSLQGYDEAWWTVVRLVPETVPLPNLVVPSLANPASTPQSGKVSSLYDNFDDDHVDPALWTTFSSDPSIVVSEASGQAQFAATSSSSGFGEYRSVNLYDATNGFVAVEAAAVGNQTGSNVNAKLQLNPGGGTTSVGLRVTKNQLRAFDNLGGGEITLTSLPWDALAMRYWRIRETAGTTYWEYSADFQTWQTLYSTPDPLNLSSVQVKFGGGSQPGGNPGLVALDNLDISPIYREGEILQALTGSWGDNGYEPPTITANWERCDTNGANCGIVSQGQTYTLASADVGSTLRLQIVAANSGGSDTLTTDPTAIVLPLPPVNTSLPGIGGPSVEAQTLTVTNGGWTSSAPLSFRYQWQRCDSSGHGCADIPNETNTTHTLTPADVDHTIVAEVWAKNAGGETLAVSQPAALVVPLAPSLSSPSGRFEKTNGIAVAWSYGGGAPVASYDVRYRAAPYSSNFGAYTSWLNATPTPSGTYAALPGYTYCFSARVRDTAGTVSAWSTEKCTSTPVDDSALIAQGAWAHLQDSRYYLGTYSTSTAAGATLSLNGIRAKRLAVLVTTCPTCGTIGFYWNGTLLQQVNLTAPATKRKQLVALPAFSSTQNGTATIKITSSGKTVEVDALGVSAK
jgi:uncharacterized delta-60 repeat protein